MEIVGVVAATKYRTMRDESPRIVYFPLAQANTGQATLYVQSTVAPSNLVAPIRNIAGELDSDAAVSDIKTLTEQVDESMAQECLTAWLASSFGIFALALATTGLYGLINYNVSSRRREIGIRMALGAQRFRVLGFVLSQSLVLTTSGICLGIVAAALATRYIASLLYGLAPRDPAALAIATTLMLIISAGAAFIPAYRASKADPMTALRYE
jgi:ABC-type antimicrobial peptide transport system permease subunit